ncbi:MAG: hypothetical protein EBV47_02745 [Actinobacteria bacterium]|nr:hypothetical protein [Actinomycetota bacterium]
MAKESKSERVETSILPIKYVDLVEDVFHAILAIIQGVNDILFIVIILEILRTVISRFTDGVYQLDKFLIIGVIAAVRHILTVGASLTLTAEKTDDAFQRALYELGLNALVVVALVFAIFLSKSAHRGRN